MKKIVLLIIAFLPLNCLASNYYSDYYLLESNSKELISESDEIKRTSERYYNTYKEEKQSVGYKESCKLKDKNDYIREIKVNKNSKPNENYLGLYKDLDTFYQFNIYTIFGDLRIYDIYILYDNEPINFEIHGQFTEDANMLQDGNLDTYVDTNGRNGLVLYFDKPIKKEKLVIKIVTDTPLKTRMGVHYDYVLSNMDALTVTANNFLFITKDEYDYIKSEVGLTDGFLTPVGLDIKYKYHCYEMVKVKQDNYVKKGNNIIKDDYYDLYTYYKRNKVVISDEKEDLSDKDLTKLIKYSNINLKNIESNIDYTKSGKYLVKFIFEDDFIVEKYVDLDIEEEKVIVKENKNTETKTIKNNKKIKQTTTKKVNEIDSIREDEIISAEPLINKINNDNTSKINLLWLIPLFFLLLICIYNLHRLLSKK